jgi:polyhydroxyalkanoate synthesis regulator phasin
MLEFIRKYVDALAGYSEVPRDRAEKIVRDLASRGEVRVRDIRKAAEQLAERSARNRAELAALIRKEIARQVSALGLATKDDVNRLAKRVKTLESGGGRRPASRSAPAAAKTRAKAAKS